jgi:5-methylcytosine-specific restriction enzyme A
MANPRADESDEKSDLWKQPLAEVRKLALSSGSAAATVKERVVIVRRRSEAVKIYVRRRAKGICECCGKPAPFTTKAGHPNLEPHHTTRLVDGGPDDPAFVGAICPNCHREIHHGKAGKDLNQKLAAAVARLEVSVANTAD